MRPRIVQFLRSAPADLVRADFGAFAVLAVLVLAATWIQLRLSGNGLIVALDGQYYLTSIAQQLALRAPLPDGSDWNPLQGLGGPWYLFDARFFPSFIAGGLSGGSSANPAVIASVDAALMAASTALVARAIGLQRNTAFAAAVIATLAWIPIHGQLYNYPIYPLAPALATVCAVCNLALAALARLARGGGRWQAVGCAIALAASALWLLSAAPIVLVIVAPGLGILWLGLALSGERRPTVIAALGVPAAIAAMLLGAGGAKFLAGLYIDTPVGLFPEAFSASTVVHSFHSGPAILRDAKPSQALWLVAVVGAVALIRGGGRAKGFAIAMLAASAALIVASVLVTSRAIAWAGPQIVYFEFVLWSAFAICASAALSPVLGRVLLPVGLAGIAALVPAFQRPVVAALPWPPAKTAIVKVLDEELAIRPGGPIRGRAVNFVIGPPPPKQIWFRQSFGDWTLHQKLGNDHRLTGLWHFGVPTLEQYSSTYSPALFVLFQAFLSRPGDEFVRNILTGNIVPPRRSDLDVLRALGIRFITASAGALDALADEAPVVARAGGPERAQQLALHRIERPLPTGFVPREVQVAPDLPSVLADLKRRPETMTAIARTADAAAAGPLGALRKAEIRVIPGGVRVTAEADGATLWVMPIGYSRCVDVQSRAGAASLHRINLAFVGVRFDRRLDATLRWRNNALVSPGCRLADYAELKPLRAAVRQSLGGPN